MSNRNKSTKAIFRNRELAKKREYMERVLEVERARDFYAFGNGNKWRNGGGVQSVLKPTSKQTGSQTKRVLQYSNNMDPNKTVI